jgi:hypothetical protein
MKSELEALQEYVEAAAIRKPQTIDQESGKITTPRTPKNQSPDYRAIRNNSVLLAALTTAGLRLTTQDIATGVQSVGLEVIAAKSFTVAQMRNKAKSLQTMLQSKIDKDLRTDLAVVELNKALYVRIVISYTLEIASKAWFSNLLKRLENGTA